MHHRFIIAIIATFIVQLSYASTVLHDLDIVAQAYTHLGEDNNYISSMKISYKLFLPYKSQAVEIFKKDESLADALSQCVFMQRGAYGEHFDNDSLDNIVNGFLTVIQKQMRAKIDLSFYRIPAQIIGIASGIFNAPCVLAIVHNERVLLLQAAAMD